MQSKGGPLLLTELKPDRRPYLGQAVLYHQRAGELGFVGSAGCVVAQVINVVDDDHVDLNLALAGVNPVVRSRVPRKSDNDPLGSWSFTDHDAEHYQADADKLKQLQEHVYDLQNQVAALKLEIASSHCHGKGRK
jgi:hypothetical protein